MNGDINDLADDVRAYSSNVLAMAIAPVAPLLIVHARHGERPGFMSQRDADAYDRGYCNYPVEPFGPRGTPEWAGFNDAHVELRHQLSSRPGDL